MDTKVKASHERVLEADSLNLFLAASLLGMSVLKALRSTELELREQEHPLAL